MIPTPERCCSRALGEAEAPCRRCGVAVCAVWRRQSDGWATLRRAGQRQSVRCRIACRGGSIEVRAREGGGTVFTSITLDSQAPYDWTQFFLPSSFTNLSSVVFTAQGNGETPEFVIDDIVVTLPHQSNQSFIGM